MQDSGYITAKPWSSNQTYFKDESLLDIESPDTATSLYVYNLNSNEELNIKLIPDNLSEAYSPNIVSESPFGILHPLNFYVGGSPKTISFSFDIHEDMVTEMGLASNLYEFVETLKKMSEPVVVQEVIREPLIYLQMGSQFAGKGHIKTSFSFNKPFNYGRYRMATISVDFTFHELFKTDDLKKLYTQVEEVESGTLGLNLSEIDYSDILDTSGPYRRNRYVDMSIEDFYEKNLDPDYIINEYIFSDYRINKIWSTVSILTWNEAARGDVYDIGIEGYRESTDVEGVLNQLLNFNPNMDTEGTIFASGENDYIIYRNFVSDLLILYAQFFNLLRTANIQNLSVTLENLETLRGIVEERRSVAEQRESNTYSDSTNWTVTTLFDLVYDLSDLLLSVINTQIEVRRILLYNASK